VLADVVAVREGPTPERKVSWIPGAEGAPIDWGWRWEWVLVWPDGGAILIAMIFDVEEKGRATVRYCFGELFVVWRSLSY